MKNVAAVILAAGEGTRINSRQKNKVTYKLNGKPMIKYPVETLVKVGIKPVVVVVKFAEKSVREALKGEKIVFARQGNRKGTAAALEDGIKELSSSVKDVMVMYGDDSTFYTPDLFRHLIEDHRKSKAVVTLLSIKLEDPTGLGRILRDLKGNVKRIVEEKVASQDQKKIREINTGLYCFDLRFLRRRLSEIEKNPVSGEYYLTDIVEMALKHGEKIHVCLYSDHSIWFGVNTRSQWFKARALKKSSH